MISFFVIIFMILFSYQIDYIALGVNGGIIE